MMSYTNHTDKYLNIFLRQKHSVSNGETLCFD